jgi:GxxExxY protein
MTRSLGFDDAETGTAIAVGIEVHRALGCGFPEQVYQEAFAIELADRRIPFEREVTLPVRFKGRLLRAYYRVDFICFERLLIELKAVAQITLVDHAQMISYLSAA